MGQLTDDTKTPTTEKAENEPADEPPIMLTRFGQRIRFKRLDRKSVSTDADMVSQREAIEEMEREAGAQVNKASAAAAHAVKDETIAERIPAKPKRRASKKTPAKKAVKKTAKKVTRRSGKKRSF